VSVAEGSKTKAEIREYDTEAYSTIPMSTLISRTSVIAFSERV
jgi:hypothetical protein